MSEKGTTPQTVRINLVVDQETREQLESVQERAGHTTMTTAIRRALRLYEVVLQRIDSGEKLILVDANGNEEIVLILL